MLHRIITAARMLRPRAIAETNKRVTQANINLERLTADVRDLRRVHEAMQGRQSDALHRIEQQLAMLQESQRMQLESLETQLRFLTRDVSELRLRESQLRAIARRDVELESRIPRLTEILDESSTAQHVRARIDGSLLHLHPFPYAVINDLLPGRL